MTRSVSDDVVLAMGFTPVDAQTVSAAIGSAENEYRGF